MRPEAKAILMVDDDEEDRMLLKDVFDDLGFGDAIHCEANGEKALHYLSACQYNGTQLPCLIVVDLNMPILNGRETLKMLKASPVWQHIPVVIYSTSLNPIERDECLALGAREYIVKPVTYKQAIEVANNFSALCTNSTAG